MELVAMELKQSGSFIARTLSYEVALHCCHHLAARMNSIIWVVYCVPILGSIHMTCVYFVMLQCNLHCHDVCILVTSLVTSQLSLLQHQAPGSCQRI